ncbi:MAG: fibronectin type III domain-containing protein [Anaerolineae bacterium]|nr:fibronectin type III domain-containing protein [Anaerolineae bacterium]
MSPTNTPIPLQPGRAHSLSAQQSGDAVNLSWSAPDDGGQVSGYRIWRRLPKKGEKALIALVDNTGSAATSYTDSSAEDRQKHIYRVQALGPSGEGQNSKPAEILVRR